MHGKLFIIVAVIIVAYFAGESVLQKTGEEPFQPYSFAFTINDDQYGSQQMRQEKSDGQGTVKGSYSYMDADGLKRLVEYIADKNGYRAMIKTNEPGMKSSYPADVMIETIGHDQTRSTYKMQMQPSEMAYANYIRV